MPTPLGCKRGYTSGLGRAIPIRTGIKGFAILRLTLQVREESNLYWGFWRPLVYR